MSPRAAGAFAVGAVQVPVSGGLLSKKSQETAVSKASLKPQVGERPDFVETLDSGATLVEETPKKPNLHRSASTPTDAQKPTDYYSPWPAAQRTLLTGKGNPSPAKSAASSNDEADSGTPKKVGGGPASKSPIPPLEHQITPEGKALPGDEKIGTPAKSERPRSTQQANSDSSRKKRKHHASPKPKKDKPATSYEDGTYWKIFSSIHACMFTLMTIRFLSDMTTKDAPLLQAQARAVEGKCRGDCHVQ